MMRWLTFPVAVLAAAAVFLYGQTAPPNAAGISGGHVHLYATDPAKLQQLLVDVLGGTKAQLGRLEMVKFPGMFIAVAQRAEPGGGNDGSAIGHIGLYVKSFADVKAKATAAGLGFRELTPNIQAFMKMVPAGVTKPYYRIDVDTPLGKAKLVFVAANAWNSTQQSWLTTQLADPTMYTFVIRHESTTSSGVPAGVTASESVVGAHPYTLELLGHTHEYRHVDTKHVISGNAGAPLSSGGGYGLLIVEQLANGNVTVSEIDESTGNPADTWTVSPTGQKM